MGAVLASFNGILTWSGYDPERWLALISVIAGDNPGGAGCNGNLCNVMKVERTPEHEQNQCLYYEKKKIIAFYYLILT